MPNEHFLTLLRLIAFSLGLLFYPVFLLMTWLCELFRKLPGKQIPRSVASEVVVVTGGANGLGKEIAIALAKKGCYIAIVDINYDKAQETAKLIADKYYARTKAYQVDVSNYEEVVKLNENVTRDLGPTTILINNAGLLMFSNLLDPDWPEMQTMINVNLTAHFWTNRVFLPKMKELKKGHIVGISSMAGMLPIPLYGVYTATKFAVRGLMRSLSVELMHENFTNIHTTTVFPMFMNTNAKVVDLASEAHIDDYYPLIKGEDAAQRIVQGMLLNEKEIIIPAYLGLYYRLLGTLPTSWQDWIVCLLSKNLSNNIKMSQSQK